MAQPKMTAAIFRGVVSGDDTEWAGAWRVSLALPVILLISPRQQQNLSRALPKKMGIAILTY